ncbi:hypothetical protein RE628_17670 [Paenibacillus sp. D2_2]|uniref:hypothetical protein n=1 Tax=Paenibacillus sp. D2_2 TaxID=3073092 RepID=UPI0028154940|nr:hypothetical protein [Paenibacillus sp. D2_2]WMT39281.1 hypothetical protein RE628_17670 [Paenibacillus sp. D2_2]
MHKLAATFDNELSTHENVLAKLKDRQYPTLLHTEIRAVREIGKGKIHIQDELVEGSRVRYRPSDILWHPIQAHRIIDKHPTVTESGIIVAHRDIEALVHLESTFPWAVRDNVEQMHITDTLTRAQRIFVDNMYVEQSRPVAHRIAVVRAIVDREAEQAYRDSTEYGYVFRDLQESRRVNKFAGYVERQRPVGKRIFKEALDVINKYALGQRDDKVEAYIEERFYEGGTEAKSLLIPEVEKGFDRTDSYNLHTDELSSAERIIEHDLWLPEEYLAEKKIERSTNLQTTNTFSKNDTQKLLHLTNKPLEFRKATKNMHIDTILRAIRDLGRPMVYRDKLLDDLAGGGWLGNKEYPGYLDEEIIVGELLQDNPAVILDMMIEAVYNPEAPGFLNEDFLIGVKERIDALIASGILGFKDGTKSGILTLNLEGVKEARKGVADIDYSLASKIAMDSVIDEEISTAKKQESGSTLDEAYFEGTKIKENQYGEIEEVIYGADYQSRPAIIQIDDYMGHLPTDRGLFPDDPEYMGAKGERGGHTSDEYTMGGKQERDGHTSEEYAMGGKYDRGGFTSDEYSLGMRSEIGGLLHTEFALGGAPHDLSGYVNEEQIWGSPNAREMYLNDEYSIGTSKLREGYTSDEYSMGTNKFREGHIGKEYSIGSAKNRELFINEEYSIGGLKPRAGAIDIRYSLATLQLRQTFLSEEYSIGTAWTRDSITNDEYTLGSLNMRQLYINDDVHTIGNRDAQRSYLGDDSLEAVVDSRLGLVIGVTPVFAVTEARISSLNDDLSAEKSIWESEIHVEIVADKSRHVSVTIEESLAMKVSRDAQIHEVENNVVKLRLSHLDDDWGIGAKSTKDAFVTEQFREGVKGAKLSEIEDGLLGRNLLKGTMSFGEETVYALKREKDSFDFGDETILSTKSAKGSETSEDLVGYKEVKDSLLYENLFALKNFKDSHLHETINSGKEKLGELEEQLVADKPQYGYLDPMLPIGGTSVKYADIPVEIVGGTPVKYGDVPIEIVGGTSLKYGDIPIEIEDGTKLKYGTIEDVLAADKPQYGNLEENLLADKPQYGHFEENLVGFKNFKDSFVHENLFVHKEAKDSSLHSNILAFKGVRDSYIQDNLFAEKGVRDGYLHEAINDVLKLRNGALDEDLLLGGKGLRDSLLESELVGIKFKKGDLIKSLLASRGGAVGYIEDNLAGGKEVREGHMHEGESNVVKVRHADLDAESFLAKVTDREAHLHESVESVVQERYGNFGDDIFAVSIQRLSYYHDQRGSGTKTLDSGFVVSEGETMGKKLMDAGLASDEYSLAHLKIRDGYTENDFTLAHKEERDSFVESSHPVGTANARLSEIEDPESMVATFEERCSQVITGFIFAERPEVRAEYLEQLFAFMPEQTAHLMEIYHSAKSEPRDSFLSTDKHLAFRDQPTEGYLPMLDTMGQGIIYDYTDNLLEQGMNPEDWEGGFGVPEDYDPSDPFNVYFPYSKNMDALELSQSDNWIKFGSGEWERDRLLGKFYSKSDIPAIGGWYRNNFLAENYKFSIDFKVDSDVDGDGAGIVFKYYDENNYWMFMVHGGDADNSLGMRRPMQLFKVQAGVPTAIGSPMQPFKWEKDKWYKLLVSVMDGRIQIYTDSKLQYDLTGTD